MTKRSSEEKIYWKCNRCGEWGIIDENDGVRGRRMDRIWEAHSDVNPGCMALMPELMVGRSDRYVIGRARPVKKFREQLCSVLMVIFGICIVSAMAMQNWLAAAGWIMAWFWLAKYVWRVK